METTYFGLSSFNFLLILSLVMTYTVAAGGWVLAKAGRSPLWIMLLLLPYVNIIGVWAFAYASWPFMEKSETTSV